MRVDQIVPLGVDLGEETLVLSLLLLPQAHPHTLPILARGQVELCQIIVTVPSLLLEPLSCVC